MVDVAFAAAAAVVAFAFALSTWERWLLRRRPHELAWTIALALFSVAAGALAYGAGVGWNEPTYKVFYFFGAIANVPILALGTTYLLCSRRTADLAAAAVGLTVAFAGGVVLEAPLCAPVPRDRLVAGKEVLGVLPRIFAGGFSGLASLVVIGGALWSAWRIRRGPMVAANALIAGGTLVTGGSGLLNSVFDEMLAFSVTLLVGISVIFCGFLVATAAPRRPPRRELSPAAVDPQGVAAPDVARAAPRSG
jgi:hypothetical protein